MLYYNRIDISKCIDINMTSVSKLCIICHYWYFLDKRFRFQPVVYNGCHDVLMMSMEINNIVILNIHGIDYLCIICGISKNEANISHKIPI